MNPRVQKVQPNTDYTVSIVFDNGEEKLFDVKPYLDKGIFQELKNPEIFKTVKTSLGSIQWENGQDFCPDTLYINSIAINRQKTG